MADLVLFGVLWVVLSVIGEIGVSIWGPNFYYYRASIQANEGLHASLFLMHVLAPIFIFVMLMLIFVPLRFRKTPVGHVVRGKKARSYVPYIAIWVTVSIAVNLLFFLHPTTSAAEKFFQENNPNNPVNKNALVIDVTARQWQWFFSYPQYGINSAQNAAGNDVLYLPVNRPVKFVLRSYDPAHTYALGVDVIHSFWIPAFGLKEDVIPGETRYEYVTPTKITSTEVNPMVRVQCAEVCGPGHPYMYAAVHIVSATAFSQWAAAQHKAGN